MIEKHIAIRWGHVINYYKLEPFAVRGSWDMLLEVSIFITGHFLSSLLVSVSTLFRLIAFSFFSSFFFLLF